MLQERFSTGKVDTKVAKDNSLRKSCQLSNLAVLDGHNLVLTVVGLVTFLHSRELDFVLLKLKRVVHERLVITKYTIESFLSGLGQTAKSGRPNK